jgi:hypothetical protein
MRQAREAECSILSVVAVCDRRLNLEKNATATDRRYNFSLRGRNVKITGSPVYAFALRICDSR